MDKTIFFLAFLTIVFFGIGVFTTVVGVRARNDWKEKSQQRLIGTEGFSKNNFIRRISPKDD